MENESAGNNNWLDWAREIQSLSQTGLAFAQTEYDKQRYTRFSEIAAEIVNNYSTLDKETLVKSFLSHPGYATPKIDVRAAVVSDGKILLVHEKSDNLWAMPGGWADVGDTPSGVVIRETKEESGFDVVPQKVIGVFDANRSGRPLEFFHAYKIIFLCELTGGEARSSDETHGAEFFSFDNLPPLSPNRTNNRHLDEIKVHLADKTRSTHFD
ncbi:MAG: NUDIX hydrolase [bacterium]